MSKNVLPGLPRALGPVAGIWEGHATDPEIRHRGASGGVITALSLFCLEREGMHGVLHTGADPDAPLRNATRLSTTRDELLQCTGSRYATASVCDSLHLFDSAQGPCVFVGQPAEVTALRKAQQILPDLDRQVGVTISFFCAGSPSSQGTTDLLRSHEINPDLVEQLRYRGLGWPGNFSVKLKGESGFRALSSYRESWGYLQRYRPYSVYLFPDGLGEDADIACGDPWYREPVDGDEGSSLVLARSERGLSLVAAAERAGYIQMKEANVRQVATSQRNLIRKRGAIWGRIATMRLMGLPAPRLKGYSLFHDWCRLPAPQKFRSIAGTARRIIQRRYFRPFNIEATSHGQPRAHEDPRSVDNISQSSTRVPYCACIMGASMGTGNRGVSALGASLVKLLNETLPECRPVMLIGNRNDHPFHALVNGVRKPVQVINYRLSPKSRPHEHILWILIMAGLYRAIPWERSRSWIRKSTPWINALAQAHFVGDIRGGDSFGDIYGSRRFVLGFLPVLAALLVRGSIVMLPQTYLPFRSRIARALARFILRRSSVVLARDRESERTARSLGATDQQLRLCPDVAFTLEPSEPASWQTEPPLNRNASFLIGVNVSGLLYRGGYTRDNMFGLKLDYPHFVRQLLARLMSIPGAEVLLVPHTFAAPDRVESDNGASEEIFRDVPGSYDGRLHLTRGEYDQHEIKWVIGRTDLFIGSRMHSCIAALSQGIPTIGVGYSGKFAGVFESVGMNEWIVDGREADEETALRRICSLLDQREACRTILLQRASQAQKTVRAVFGDIIHS